MAVIERRELIQRYSAALAAGNAALFVGAGISIAAGFVNWRDLLRDIARDLGLDVDKEADLISLAQFHVNSRQSRARINETLIDEFTKDAKLTENHSQIAALPIETIWTTNYDDLIEQAFIAARKKPDVKTTVPNLAQTRRDRDVVIYKMHGDRSQPQNAILIREDYENYSETHGAFSLALQGDLVERTFLFLGFSFTDPNIDYILARVGILLGKSQRDHFCIMKRPTLKIGATPEEVADHAYNLRRLELRLADLGRYRISSVVIDSYSETTEILDELNRASHLKDVFVSGSNFGTQPLDNGRLEEICRKLGSALIEAGLNLSSGFGLGIGSAVSYGAMKAVYGSQLNPNRLRIMPFPQIDIAQPGRTELFTKHRETMISQVGFCVFIAGNRASLLGIPENSPGVVEEFAIACKFKKIPIPFGASGWSAQMIWSEVSRDLPRYFGDVNVDAPFNLLNTPGLTDTEYVDAIIEIIRRCSR